MLIGFVRMPTETVRVCRGRENVLEALKLEEQGRRKVCSKYLIKRFNNNK
jgi:hypothetical protein